MVGMGALRGIGSGSLHIYGFVGMTDLHRFWDTMWKCPPHPRRIRVRISHWIGIQGLSIGPESSSVVSTSRLLNQENEWLRGSGVGLMSVQGSVRRSWYRQGVMGCLHKSRWHR
jgi:hypothetical protein